MKLGKLGEIGGVGLGWLRSLGELENLGKASGSGRTGRAIPPCRVHVLVFVGTLPSF